MELITVLHLTIHHSEKINADCNTNKPIAGCIIGNDIYLSYYSFHMDFTLWHEIGHAMFRFDEEMKEEIKKYPMLFENEGNNDEILADYFAYSNVFPELFQIKYPELAQKFKEKINIKIYEKQKTENLKN
jgi:hypothetical protein